MTRRFVGGDEAMRFFRCSLHHVAKCGEVWCEGARIFMDPQSRYFNLKNAATALNYSSFFTPQYGDTYIEVETRCFCHG